MFDFWGTFLMCGFMVFFVFFNVLAAFQRPQSLKLIRDLMLLLTDKSLPVKNPRNS